VEFASSKILRKHKNGYKKRWTGDIPEMKSFRKKLKGGSLQNQVKSDVKTKEVSVEKNLKNAQKQIGGAGVVKEEMPKRGKSRLRRRQGNGRERTEIGKLLGGEE